MIKNLTTGLCALSLVVIATAIAPSTQAQTIHLPLGGNTSYDQWEDSALTAITNNAGYPEAPFPGFMTSGNPWPRPILSNVGGDAELHKVSNGINGSGPYPASSSLYYAGFSTVPNVNGGTVGVVDETPLANVKTVVFQLEIGGASGYDLYLDSEDDPTPPQLYYTTGGNRIALDGPAFSFTLVNSVDTGTTFPNPETGDDEPIYLNTWAFQWDLNEVTTPITKLEIEFIVVEHAQVYGLQLDQSDFAHQNNVAAIPEPGSWSLLLVTGVGAILLLRRRKTRLA